MYNTSWLVADASFGDMYCWVSVTTELNSDNTVLPSSCISMISWTAESAALRDRSIPSCGVHGTATEQWVAEISTSEVRNDTAFEWSVQWYGLRVKCAMVRLSSWLTPNLSCLFTITQKTVGNPVEQGSAYTIGTPHIPSLLTAYHQVASPYIILSEHHCIYP